MALKLWVDDIETVAEHLRSEYKKQANGRWKLDGDDFDGVDDIQDMKTRLGRANNEAGTRRRQMEAWEKLGKSPEEIQELLQKQAENEQKELEKKGEWDTLKQQMAEQHKAENQRILAELEAERKANEDYFFQTEANTALGKHKGSARVLLPHLRPHAKVLREDGGKPTLRIMAEDGKTPRVKSDGSFVTLEDLVLEMKKDPEFSRQFEGTSHSGGGAANGSGGQGGTPQGTNRSKMSVEQKAEYIQEHGRDAYMQLPT